MAANTFAENGGGRQRRNIGYLNHDELVVQLGGHLQRR
jgi:hypothetical protein